MYFGDKNRQMESSDVVWCHQLTSLTYKGRFRSSRRVVQRSSSVVTWVVKRTSYVVTWVVKRASYVVTWVVIWSSPRCHLRSSVVLVVTLVVHVVSRQLSIDEIVTQCNYTWQNWTDTKKATTATPTLAVRLLRPSACFSLPPDSAFRLLWPSACFVCQSPSHRNPPFPRLTAINTFGWQSR